MPKKPDSEEMVNLQELHLAQMIQIDTVFSLLIEKGVITQEQSFEEPKQVKVEHESRKRS